jgi:beta-glucosidase
MYRFSISWSRILPSGRGAVNPKGIEFYNNLINELLKRKIIPVVTLFHWDMPQILHEEYGGFLNAKVVEDFTYYAKVCFDNFGDRVQQWITLNEPYITSAYGFYEGINPPQRCADRRLCTEGDSNEVYLVTHHQILCHGRAVELYRNRYQRIQGGTIGVSLNSDWYEPYSDTQADKEACERQLIFQIGWFADPIWFGDYPSIMKDRVKERLPVFTQEEKNMLRNSSDFFGLNHYTSRFVRSSNENIPGYFTDREVQQSVANIRGELIGQKQHPDWLWSYPKGFRKLLNWIDQRYNDTVIYVSENGVAERNTGVITTRDPHRIKYYDEYLDEMWGAIYQDGVNIKSYLAWSFMDNCKDIV